MQRLLIAVNLCNMGAVLKAQDRRNLQAYLERNVEVEGITVAGWVCSRGLSAVRTGGASRMSPGLLHSMLQQGWSHSVGIQVASMPVIAEREQKELEELSWRESCNC